ncbi:unnamed protein product [Symbiodinium sp. CCMP2592]|nr:unnamed protein product [Symbiodinium sp. CCMP2592]
MQLSSAGATVVHPVLAGANSDSSFIQYFAWFQGVQGYLLERSSDGPLFPCALPYPEAILTEEVRGVAAEVTMWWSKAFLNTFVGWGNFVTLGCPAPKGSGREPRVSYRACRDIRAFCDKLLGEMGEFVSLELVAGRLACDGKRSVVESLLAQVQCTVGASYFHDGAAAGEASTVALPVEASRVAIPSQAGLVDPCRWLEGERRETVQNLASLRKPEYLWDEIPVACHRVPVEEEPALADKLLATRMAVLVPESDLPRDSRGELLLGGLFCVAKNSTEDRLIFDRRPENATMHRLSWARLPAGACFARLLLGPREYLRGSGHDLRNYYYTLRLPEGWVRYNGFGRRVCPQVVAKHNGDPKIAYRLAFRVLGMGDKNGCDIAQAVHESLLRRHGVLDPRYTLVYGDHIPQESLLEGVYLDDLLIAKKCELPDVIPLDGSFVPPPAQVNDSDVLELKAAENAYEEAGLERAEHKAFRQLVHFKAWGAEVDGVQGRAGAPLDARRQVWGLIAKLVTGGFASRVVLQRVVGYLAFIFQFRRELYGLLHHMYKYLAKMPEGRWVPLPGHILDELRSCALHLPFATWNMRKHLSSTVIATDATPTAGGAVTARVPKAVAQALWRHTEVKGEAVRLDRDLDFEADADRPREASRFASMVSECLCWKVESGYTFRQTSHINLQEMRALKKELVKLAGDSTNAQCIFLFFNDSRVVCGALGKGRSSSFKLNGIIRTIIPHLMLSGITLGLLWVETASNLADHPSRFRSLPPPCSAPLWLRQLGVQNIMDWVGIEVFSEKAVITEVHRKAGVTMLEPWFADDVSADCEGYLEDLLRGGQVRWAWFAPPCESFSPLRNLDPGGPLRRRGEPEGDSWNIEVRQGNMQWRRSLWLMRALLEAGGVVFLVHPKNSAAWRLEETNRFIQQHSLRRVHVDSCAYVARGTSPQIHPNRKSLTIVTNSPWIDEAVLTPGFVRAGLVKSSLMPSYSGRKPVPLYRAALSAEYRRGLRAAAVWLLSLASALGAKLSVRTSSRVVDAWLEKVVNVCYERGERFYRVRLGVLGVQRALRLSGPLLRGTWAALRGWRTLLPVNPRIPMSKYIMQAVLVTFLATGFREEGRAREQWWSAFIGTWLSFEGLLRPGEMDKLFVGDITFPEGDWPASEQVGMVLCLRTPKTKRVWRTQFVLLKDEQLIAWMRWWCSGRPAHRRVLRTGRRDWAKRLSLALSRLDLADRGFTLGSLRGGGATHLFRVTENIARVQYHGRWSRQETVKAYLQEGLSTQTLTTASALARQRLQLAHQSWELLRAPPPRELAAALEEEDWELVDSSPGGATVAPAAKTGPKARAAATRRVSETLPSTSLASSSTSAVPSKGTGKGVGEPVDTTASSNVYHRDVRTYLILSNPREPSFVGVIQGRASEVWPKLEARLPGGQLFGSAVRLRKVADEVEAQTLWNQHRPGVPLPKLQL